MTPFHTRLSRGVYDESLSVALRGSLLAMIASDDDLPGLEARRFALPGLGNLSLHRLPYPSPRLENSILQFSSGTTGLKKGVPISAEALAAQLATYGDAIAISRSDHILSWLPLYHDMGFIACLNLPLYHGVSATLIDTFDWLAVPAPGMIGLSRFNGWPVLSPADASPAPLRTSAHGSGPMRIAIPSS